MTKDSPRFRIISRKPAPVGEQKLTIQDQGLSSSTPDSTPGFNVQSVRRLDPAEQAEQRTRNADFISRAITHAASDMSTGEHIALPLQVHTQRHDNTCLLACSIAVAESVGRIASTPRSFDESQLAALAREQGLLAGGGMATQRPESRQHVFDFIQTHLGLSVAKTVSVDVTSPEQLGLECVSAIRNKNVALLNYPLGTTGHWVAIFALTKKVGEKIHWSVMNPLLPSTENLTNDQLVHRLLGTALTGDRGGRYGELFILDTKSAKSGFRIISKRPPRPQ